MGTLFCAFVVLVLPKEYLLIDKKNIEDFINLVDRYVKQHKGLSKRLNINSILISQ